MKKNIKIKNKYYGIIRVVRVEICHQENEWG
jgi:hypothetical protein